MPMQHQLASVGNAGDMVALAPSQGRSAFQLAVACEVAARPDFAHFCADPTCDESYDGPVTFVFYTTDGVLHAWRVGTRRILRKVAAA